MFDHPLALELAYTAVEEAIRLGASYADARYELRHFEDVRTRNGRLAHAGTTVERGIGLRVLVRGAWGYVGISEPNRHDVAVAAKRAVAAARAASILQGRPVELTRQEPQRALFRTKIRRDPLAVPLEDKIELLLSVDDALRAVDGVTLADGRVQSRRVRKIFVSSDGSELDQELVSCGVGYRAGALFEGDLQFRSFPAGRDGLVLGQGWELVSELPLLDAAPDVAAEAVELSRAEPCPAGIMNAVLTGPLVAHQALHTAAPLFELDRALGLGAGETGGSFLGLDGLGSFEVGAPVVNVYADARELGGAGTFGYDDEGVEAQRVELVTEGRFTGVLSNREAAHRVGLEGSSGCARAVDWSEPPSVWPTNIGLAPGEGTLDDLLEAAGQGVLLDGPAVFTLDAFGRTFTAAPEVAWEIEGGKRGRMLKNPTYQGATTRFWRGCEAIAGADDWNIYGAYLTPRGRSRRRLPVGAGAASARFTGVSVGNRATRPAAVEEGEGVSVIDDGPAAPSAPRKSKGTRRAKRKGKRVRKKDTK